MTPAINLTDGYKVDHRRQMPEEAFYQLNNFTPRKTRRTTIDRIVFFGLQYFIRKYMIEAFDETFFKLPKEVVVKSYMRRINNYLGPGHRVTPFHIEKLHDLGYLPIKIKALPEGSLVNIKVPPVTIESTIGHEYVWLVGYLETIFSATVWGPCTSATSAFEYRRILDDFAMTTVGNTEFVPFQGHDFSFRGMFGLEAAQMSGAAHLLSFVGTDTIPAIDFLEDWYYADSDKELIGCSVAATEHSVMCTGTGVYIYRDLQGDWERIGEAEKAVFKRLITEVYPTGIISIVSDTFDLWQVCTQFLVELKEEVLARDGKVVIRPDSGDPVDILCGEIHNKSFMTTDTLDVNVLADLIEEVVIDETPHGERGPHSQTELFKFEDEFYCVTHNNMTWNRYDKQYYYLEMWEAPKITIEKLELEPKHIGVVELLWNTFGGTISDKGYKILDSHIGCIYGDSINTDRCTRICQRLMDKGFASINWVTGIGSFTYQYVTRDTDGWAMKATFVKAKLKVGEIEYNSLPIFKEVEIPIFKDPKTDDGTKKSARGRVVVERHQIDNQITNRVEKEWFVLKDQATEEEFKETALKTVFKNGELIRTYTLAQIRKTLERAGKLM